MLGIEFRIPEMDFEGQKLAEILQYVILGLFGIAGFIWGYICESFQQTFYVVAVGSMIASMVVMPPWPIFRKHPLPFPAAKTELKKPAAVAKGKSKKKN
ncbi:hypothetical protein ACHWQZ_G014425 [Mnemiopsis leidyi]